MDEDEFQRILSLFPVVRSSDYHVDCVALSSQSTSQSGKDELEKWQEGSNEEDRKDNETQDDFWGKLRLAAANKVGKDEAEKFCDAFRTIYSKLVYEGMSEEAALRFINSQTNPRLT